MKNILLAALALLGSCLSFATTPQPVPSRVIVYPKEGGGLKPYLTVLPGGDRGASPTPTDASTPLPKAGQSPSTNPDQASQDQLIKQREDFSKASAALNGSNPLVDDALKVDSSQLTEQQRKQMESMQALVGNPFVKNYLKALTRPATIAAATALAPALNWKKLSVWELVGFFVYLLVRGTVIERYTRRSQRFVASFVCWFAWLVFAWAVIPSYVVGPVFQKFMVELLRGFGLPI